MNKKLRTILYIVLFIVFMVGAGLAYRYLSNRYSPENSLTKVETSRTPPSVEPGNQNQSPSPAEEDTPQPILAPDFTAVDWEGNEVKLSDYRGTPVVLNFWASWCPPCKSEMPHFNKVSEEYEREELIFLMVDLVDGQREKVETGKEYIEDNQFTFTVLFDTHQEGAITYGVRSIPSTLFIDKDGYIQAGVEGAIDEDTLRRGIALIYEE